MANEITTRPGVPPRTQSLTDTGKVRVLDAVEKLVGVRSAAAVMAKAADFVDTVVTTADWGGTATETSAKLLEHPRFGKLAGQALGRATDKTAHLFEALATHAERVGIAAAGLSAGLTSDAQSLGGKIGEGVMVAAGTKMMVTGMTGYAINGVKIGNPLMLADMAMNYVGASVIGEKNHQRAGGYITGHVVNTPAKLAVAYYEAIANGDMTALDKFSEDAKAGKLGIAYQVAIESGEMLSGSIVDGIEATVGLFGKVSKFFGA